MSVPVASDTRSPFSASREIRLGQRQAPATMIHHTVNAPRWAEPRAAGNAGVTQGMHVRPILVDPCGYLISSADGPMAGDEDIDVAPAPPSSPSAAR
jgi:hypothetical protein